MPVMLAQVLDALAPRDGETVVDGTFGAGGYARAILRQADTRVFGIDRDPEAVAGGAALLAEFPGRLTLIEGRFAEMEQLLAAHGIAAVDGVALDVGVSSMQLDRAERGFSFAKDGPLDMRMAQAGLSAADVVNGVEPATLTRIIGILGEEAKAKAIARAIVAARARSPILTTGDLVGAVEKATGQRPQDRIHPATRTFQALRIYVNGELDELAEGLAAAERLLRPSGRLAAVTFHSLEDRIVKRFLTARAGHLPLQSRHLPETAPGPLPSFELLFKGHAHADEPEMARNPRSRSAKLRAARRTAAPPIRFDPVALGVPRLTQGLR